MPNARPQPAPPASPFTADLEVWRLASWKKERGLLWALESGRSGAATERQRIFLGFGKRESFELALDGINHLEEARRAARGYKVLAPDPALEADLVPPGPGEDGSISLGLVVVRSTKGNLLLFPSPTHLGNILACAQGELEKERARARVLTYLCRMGEVGRLVKSRGAEVPGGRMGADALATLIRSAGLGIDYAVLPLREYVRTVWEPVRRASNADTWRKEEGLLRLHLLPRLGHVAIGDIDPRDVHACICDALKQDGKPLSYNTRRLTRAACAAVFAFAYTRKHINHELRFEGLEKMRGSKEKPLAQQSVTREQMLAVIGSAATARDRALLSTILGTGVRPSELAGLDWGDVTWEGGKRHPHGVVHVQPRDEEGEPCKAKTKESDRTIPMTGMVREPLFAYWQERGRPPAGRVFLTREGKPYATGDGASYYGTMLRNAADRAGLVGVRVTPYTCRHTTGTLLREAGATAEQVKALMGHSAVSKVFETNYDHRSTLTRVQGRDLPDLRVVLEEEG